MILIDLQQVMISNLMVQIGNHHNVEIQPDMIRHMVLNSIRSYKMKFSAKYGEIIICCDDKHYWRRDVFPYYKATRKIDREKSELNWGAIFDALNDIREELKQFFPYRVIQVPTAEADDIIGTIVHKEGRVLNSSGKPILILSGDKDYIQLHKYANVEQYDAVRNRWIKSSDPEGYLFEHIVRGDRGDGIPNIFSPDNTLVTAGARQKKVTAKRLQQVKDGEDLGEEVKRGWIRNQSLIDLEKIPDHITNSVLQQYEAENTKDKSKLFNYFIQKRLKNLMEHISEF